jgi:hypothetical protein
MAARMDCANFINWRPELFEIFSTDAMCAAVAGKRELKIGMPVNPVLSRFRDLVLGGKLKEADWKRINHWADRSASHDASVTLLMMSQ